MELHVYYSKQMYLRVSWGPVITAESLRRHYDLLIANVHYPRDLRVITSSDVEELGFALTESNMQLFKEWREEALSHYRSIATAVYNLNPVPAAYLSYFSEFFDSSKSTLKQFSSEEAALLWLLQRGISRDGIGRTSRLG